MSTKKHEAAKDPNPASDGGTTGKGQLGKLLEEGQAALKARQHEVALGRFLQVVKAAPDFGPAHRELGLAYLAINRLDDAHAELRRAVELTSSDFIAWMNLGNLARRQRNWRLAREAFDKAVALRPASLEAGQELYRLQKARRDTKGALESVGRLLRLKFDEELAVEQAELYQAAGDVAAAETVYDSLLARRPVSPKAVESWGGFLNKQGRHAELVERLKVLAQEQPDEPMIWGCLGTAWTHVGDHEAAAAALRRANELSPGSSKVLHDLGVVSRTLGRLDEARQWFAKCLEADPYNASALRVYGNDHKYAYGDDVFRRLNIAATRLGQYPPQGRVQLHYALGKAYEDVGEMDVAFAHYTVAGQQQKRLSPHDDRVPATLLRFLRSRMKAEDFARAAARGHPSEKPVFVLGMPRSGTSLIEQIVSSHPAVFGAGELKVAGKVLANFTIDGVKVIQSRSADAAHLDREPSLYERGAQYVAEIEKLAGSGDYRHIVDKMPANYLWAGFIHMMLPRARLIHSRRHPVEICLSAFRIYFPDGQTHTYDLRDLGRAYRLYDEFMKYWHEVLPAGTLLDVRYEDVVADTEGQARRMIDFLGLDWNDACLRFHETDRPVRTASASQVRKPVYTTSVNRWRKYEPYLKPLLEELGDLVKQYEDELTAG